MHSLQLTKVNIWTNWVLIGKNRTSIAYFTIMSNIVPSTGSFVKFPGPDKLRKNSLMRTAAYSPKCDTLIITNIPHLMKPWFLFWLLFCMTCTFLCFISRDTHKDFNRLLQQQHAFFGLGVLVFSCDATKPEQSLIQTVPFIQNNSASRPRDTQHRWTWIHIKETC